MQNNGYTKVYQFKIRLKDIRPPIWRRIQVPSNSSFWDLHLAIQHSMGWMDKHLHAFHARNLKTGRQEEIGVPDRWSGFSISAGWERRISHFFSPEQPRASYEYDFGDGWRHDVQLEKILPREEGAVYPRCLKGKRACPPENCGGISGYEEMLKAIADPGHQKHKSSVEWLGGEFDPEHFDPARTVFEGQEESWRDAFSGSDEVGEETEDDDVHKILRGLSRDRMHGIWRRAKAGDLEDLSGEDSLLAQTMLEHEEDFFSDFEFADVMNREYDPGEGPNPFLHISIHTIIENQLAQRDPVEVFQFHNAMKKKKCSHHEAIHLIGAVLAPLMFSVMQEQVPFDVATYRDLLRKYKTRSPAKMGRLLEKEPKLYPP